MRSQNKDKRRLGYVVATLRALFAVSVCRLRTISVTKSNYTQDAGPTNTVFLHRFRKKDVSRNSFGTGKLANKSTAHATIVS